MEGGKEDKLVVPKFNDKPSESFHLWKLRMEAVLETRGCLSLTLGDEPRPTADSVGEDDDLEEAQEAYDKLARKAAAWIVTSLGDKPLKVVQKVSKSPSQM